MDDFGGQEQAPIGPRLDNFTDPNTASVNPANTVQNTAPIDPMMTNQYAATPAEPSFQAAPITEPSLDTQMPVVASSNGGKGKTILLIVLSILLLAGAGSGGYFVGLTNGKSQGRNEAAAEFQAEQANQQAEADSADQAQAADQTNEKLDLGDLVEPEYKDENIEGEVGKQLVAGDGFVLKVTNIERNFKPTDPNYKLDTGKELVKVNFVMGNIAKDTPKDMSSVNFRLENSTGAQLVPENLSDYEGKFDTTKLDPGSQANGSIVYLVKKDEKPLKFVRSQQYRITNQNREVTTKITVTLAK